MILTLLSQGLVFEKDANETNTAVAIFSALILIMLLATLSMIVWQRILCSKHRSKVRIPALALGELRNSVSEELFFLYSSIQMDSNQELQLSLSACAKRLAPDELQEIKELVTMLETMDPQALISELNRRATVTLELKLDETRNSHQHWNPSSLLSF
jgi:hypothetical protein